MRGAWRRPLKEEKIMLVKKLSGPCVANDYKCLLGLIEY